MSNHLAFATLTYVLQRELDRAVGADVSGATATAVRPDGGDGTLPTPGVNVFLLQVNPSGEVGSFDLPTRNVAGSVVNRPQSVYELIYILTFHGAEAKLEPQRCQASVLRRLYGAPVITTGMIRDAVAAAVTGDPNHFLKGSNLADQASTVKLSPHKISLDDLSKIWSVFFQTNYLLTSTFKATYVILDSEQPGQSGFPVRFPGAFALPFGGPQIGNVVPDRIAFSATADVVLNGQSLTGTGLHYLVDDDEAVLQPNSTATAAKIRLPATARAGVKTLRIVSDGPLGPGHRGAESNVVPLLLLPAVSAIAYQKDASAKKDHTIEVTPAMTVGLSQRTALVLNRTDNVTPSSYELTARPRLAEADHLIFAAHDVPAGTYLYRLRVDGLDSELTLDTTDPDPLKQPYNGPTLVVAP